MNHELPKNHPEIVSPDAWTSALRNLLVKEKELAHARDAVGRGR